MRKVLVIVLNYNKKEMVLDCLSSLERQSYPHCHVVVFDNASTDGSQDAIRERYPQADLVCSDVNLGACRGRNEAVLHGGRSGDFDYVLFLDDDAETAADSIRRLVDAIEVQPEAGIACGKTYTGFDTGTIMSAGIRARLSLGICYDRGAGDPDSGQYDDDRYVDACGAFAFMIRASLFHELGGFDTSFSPYGWEDVDLCLRARKRGHRTRYVHDAVFAHKGTRLGRKPVPDYERNKARNFLTLLVRHTTITGKLSAAFFVPLRALMLFVRFAVQGDWRVIPAQLRGVVESIRARKNKTSSAE